MGHRHTKDEILAGALDAAFADGFSQLTFGRVAKHLGISDRVVVYYFPTKDDLIGEVILSMGVQLQTTLGQAFTKKASNYQDLARIAWPILARNEADPVFALFFEANGLAAAGRAPYDTLVPAIVSAWIDWTAEFLDGTAKQRKVEAETTIALIDGLLILRQLQGPAAASRAAKRLGIA